MPSCYNLILQKILYMFRAMKVHHQEVTYRIQVTSCCTV